MRLLDRRRASVTTLQFKCHPSDVSGKWGSMTTIKVAVIGVGNCASSLVQGKYHYAGSNNAHGLIHEDIGGYKVADLDFVAAFDVDSRKVGLDLGEAIFAKPNCTKVFADRRE